jgi:hypothetical protein
MELFLRLFLNSLKPASEADSLSILNTIEEFSGMKSAIAPLFEDTLSQLQSKIVNKTKTNLFRN